MLNHCLNCTVLDGCYFVDRNKPALPLHTNCDCKKLTVNSQLVKNVAKVTCPISKFSNYTFDANNSKNNYFNKLGYTINDAEYLKTEFEKQAKKQYLMGKYKLNKLDKYGQRLTIKISLNGVDIKTGWIMFPEGYILNITTFSGRWK